MWFVRLTPHGKYSSLCAWKLVMLERMELVTLSAYTAVHPLLGRPGHYCHRPPVVTTTRIGLLWELVQAAKKNI